MEIRCEASRRFAFVIGLTERSWACVHDLSHTLSSLRGSWHKLGEEAMKAGGQLKGEEEFFTFREYMKKEEDLLTASMEDYLEMVYRLSRESGFTRVNELAAALNVQPPSASKMIQKMSDQGLVDYEKYGYVVLTSKGQQMGGELLYRHQLVEEFLIILGVSKGLLEQIEKIEHTLSDHTLFFLDKLIRFLKERPGLIDDYHKFINSVKAGE
mgnify:CR=1 FL=1